MFRIGTAAADDQTDFAMRNGNSRRHLHVGSRVPAPAVVRERRRVRTSLLRLRAGHLAVRVARVVSRHGRGVRVSAGVRPVAGGVVHRRLRQRRVRRGQRG